jgi:phosphatidylserine/phosphatidylglycerophosphate/cardiolipin synthase-like enzyme
MTEFVTDREIYEKVILGRLPTAAEFIWIGTADLKDMYVERRAGRASPLLGLLAELIEDGVSVRLIHAKEPGPAFREDFDRYPALAQGLEQILCPRVHFKCVIVDGAFAYTGSANLTGAGMGAKSVRRRNFESGIVTTDPAMVSPIMEQFDNVWMGKYCAECERKDYCTDFNDLL